MTKDNLDEIIHSLQETNRRQSNLLRQNRETFTRLRAANKKLRAKLAKAMEAQREYAKHAFADYARLYEWKAAHRQLAEAIGGKAK